MDGPNHLHDYMRVDKVYGWFTKNDFKYLQFIPCLDSFNGNKEAFSLDVKTYEEF